MTTTWLDGIVASNRATIVVNDVVQTDTGELEFEGPSVSVSSTSTRTTITVSATGGGTPDAHAASHQNGGSDEIATATPGANAIPKAGAGGTLAAGWIPTGTTSGTIPILGTDGKIAESTLPPNVARWYSAPGSLNNTAPAADTIAIVGCYARPMQPIKILDNSGIIMSSSSHPKIKTVSGVTGLAFSKLDYRGNLYFKSVATSDPTYRFDIYSDVELQNLVGHTSTFNASLAADSTLTITADNGSGLGGSVVVTSIVEARAPNISHVVCFAKVGVVTSASLVDEQLLFNGPAVSTSASMIREVQLGSHSVVWIHGTIPGAYAGATTSQALADRMGEALVWGNGPGVIVWARAKNLTNDTGATQAVLVPVVNGQVLVADGSGLTIGTGWNSIATTLSAEFAQITNQQAVELRVVKGTNGNSRDLIFDLYGVEL